MRAWHNLFSFSSISIIISSRLKQLENQFNNILSHYHFRSTAIFVSRLRYKNISRRTEIEIFPQFTKPINFQLATITD